MDDNSTFPQSSGETTPPFEAGTVSILVDINLQCRICLRVLEGGTEVTSFFESLQKDFKLFEFFEGVFTIKGNMAIPKIVCDICASTIRKFESLLVTFGETEDYLKTLPEELSYTEEIIIKDESPPTTPPEGNDESTNKLIDETDTELLLESLKYSCTICDDVFLQRWPFVQHMSTKHDIHLKIDQAKLFASKLNVTIPKSTPETTLQPQHKCTACPKSDHPNVHKKFACTHCDASFVKKDYLKEHLSRHSTESQFVCNVCGKSLRYRSALTRHKRGHLNIKQHVCETCGLNFKENYTLLTHKKLKHSDEMRRYPCSACGIVFKLKSWRDRHFKKKHMDEEAVAYACNLCRVSYKYQSSLNRHFSQKHSTNNNYYSCKVCGRTYSNKDNLKRHVMIHRSREEMGGFVSDHVD